jgi:hypothetical protein
MAPRIRKGFFNGTNGANGTNGTNGGATFVGALRRRVLPVVKWTTVYYLPQVPADVGLFWVYYELLLAKMNYHLVMTNIAGWKIPKINGGF